MKTILISLVLVIATLPHAVAAPFSNLDFEMANTNGMVAMSSFPFPNGFGTREALLPQWSLRADTFDYPSILFNGLPLSGETIPTPAIFSRESELSFGPDWLKGILTGKFLLFVRTTDIPLLMSQVGDIPEWATELRLTDWHDRGSYLKTYLNKTEILNGDISAFAGQRDVELKFEFGQGIRSEFLSPNYLVDRIEFIPEPGTWALMLVGGAALLFVLRRRGAS